jgi:hypothetical protein
MQVNLVSSSTLNALQTSQDIDTSGAQREAIDMRSIRLLLS